MTRPADDQSQRRVRAATRFFSQMRRLRRLLRRHWWLVAISMGLAVGAVYALITARPPSFFSTGQMTVNMKLSGATAPLYMEELYNFLGTQAALLKSETVALRARMRLQSLRPNLRPCPVKLQVAVSPKTSVFNLRADGTDPDYTQAWLDACMESYLGLKRQMRKSNSDTAISGVSDELLRLDNEIQRRKEDLINFSASNSVVLLQGNSAATYLENLTRRLADAKLESQLLNMLTLDENVRRQEERARQVSSPDKAVNPESTAASLTRPGENGNSSVFNPSRPTLTGPEGDYLKADQQIQLMKAELKDLGKYLRPRHPRMIALGDEIARTERLLEIFRQQSAEQLASREHSLEIEIRNDEAEVKTWKEKAIADSKVLATYQSLKENNQHLQEMYNSLMATSRTIDVDKEMSPETVTIFQPATDPRPVPPQIAEKLTLGGLGGFVLALGFLLWRDRMDDRPASLIEVQALFDEPVLGQIPFVRPAKRRARVPHIQPDDDRHAFKEAYCNLRSALLYMESGGSRPKQILITSAIPNDGKSMTAANLAITLAEAGSTVLLVDADLRRGSLHELFSFPVGPGLAGVLSGESPLTDCVLVTTLPNLSFLPRGNADRSPGRLFLGPEADAFLAETRMTYDFVVFDTAPIVAADDVSNLAPKMDGVIMVIRANHTPGRVARAAIELLYLRQVRVLGLVFNAIEAAFNEYYYYNYSAYYHHPRKVSAVAPTRAVGSNGAEPTNGPLNGEGTPPNSKLNPGREPVEGHGTILPVVAETRSAGVLAGEYQHRPGAGPKQALETAAVQGEDLAPEVEPRVAENEFAAPPDEPADLNGAFEPSAPLESGELAGLEAAVEDVAPAEPEAEVEPEPEPAPENELEPEPQPEIAEPVKRRAAPRSARGKPGAKHPLRRRVKRAASVAPP